MLLRRLGALLGLVAVLLALVPSPAHASGGSPYGSFDQTVIGPASVQVQGWAIDPDTTDQIDVHVYVDGVFATSAHAEWGYPGAGNHGFFVTTALAPGFHDVCVYAISAGPGDNTLLGCKTVYRGVDPFGSLDSVQLLASGPTALGWVLDPDSYDAIDVHIYVDGVFAGAGRADQPSPDVSAAYPAWGFGSPGNPDHHRFAIPIALTGGPHAVCAYGIGQDVGPGTNALLGCIPVNVAVDPFGSLDIAAANTLRNLVNVHGWAIDPDYGGPIDVHLYADGQFVGVMTANRFRPDVGAAFGTTDDHGYAGPVSVPPGASTLCAYGINAGSAGTNALLGCLPIDWSGNPIGEVRPTGESCAGGHVVRMWAIDPDSFVHLHIDVYQRQPDGSEQIYARQLAAEFGDATWQPQFPYYDANHFVRQFCSPGNLDYFAINLGTTPGENTLIASD